MRRILSFAILLAISISLFAQRDVTKFLGIPVDGTKPAMLQKLREKGFVNSAAGNDLLEGEFNGTQVCVSVHTNNNKVWRIALFDENPTDITNIKIRFNRLCEQFRSSPNYFSVGDYKIADDEDISYEMIVNNKRYEATFFQKSLDSDTSGITAQLKKVVWFMISQNALGYCIYMFYENKYNEANGQEL